MRPAALALLVALAAVSLALARTPSAHAAGPLATALIEFDELSGPDADLALQRVRDSGARYYRLMLPWYTVAPVERPDTFDAANPSDPAYRWDAFDRKLALLAKYQLEPIVVIMYPPEWAGGGYKPTPDPTALQQFAHAVAERYNGSFQALPRVRYWMAWNEPNVAFNLSPQFDGDDPVAPVLYRGVVNAIADGVHAVHADNMVIAGALSPFEIPRSSGDYQITAPMLFMRRFLCLSDGTPPQATCDERVHFDIWAHHPYTRGGPTHRADSPDDASLGDLGRMKDLLDAAVRMGHVVSQQPVDFWATEFSWDTNPPDPNAVPLRLQARWVSEAMYRMWKVGISLVAWLELRDEIFPEQPAQAGLWYHGGPRLACDQPKQPTLDSFRFPFVAYRQGKGILVWGRTPAGVPSRVIVEQATPKGWKKAASLRSDGNGIFTRVLPRRPVRGRFSEAPPTPLPYATVVSCDLPRSYWRLGERSGDRAADAMGRADGTFGSGVALATGGAVAGDTGVTLDGTGRIDLGPVSSPRTVEFWMQTRTPADGAVFSNRNDIHHYVYLGTTGDGHVLAFDSHPLPSAQRINDGKWHYVAYTYDGKTGRLYVDGKLSASADWERLEGTADASVGYDASTKTHFRGSVDELAVYDFPLTAAQVAAHFAARAPKPGRRPAYKGSFLRARLPGSPVASAPFSLAIVPDRPVHPFG